MNCLYMAPQTPQLKITGTANIAHSTYRKLGSIIHIECYGEVLVVEADWIEEFLSIVR